MKFGYQTNTWGGVVGHPAGVTSIKDLFYLTYGSDDRALRDIAAAGYQGFEIFDGNLQRYADDPSTFKSYISETNLDLIAVYSGANFIYADCLDDEFARLEQAAQLGQQFGALYHVIGGGAIRTDGVKDSDYETLARGLNRFASMTSRYGLQGIYHPHLGTMAQSPEELHRICRLTDIPLCPDTGHIIAGGGDPVEIIRSYRERIPYVHFKDYADGRFLPLGEGVMDVPGVVAALGNVPDGTWWTVELDETDKDPRVAAEESLQVLKGLVRSR
ncbi:MAG: sugar phosphate isomerase/epimerase [Chloroflexota bacterium]